MSSHVDLCPTFASDAAGRSARVTYPDGHIRAQLYDSEGRLASRCYTYGGTSYCYTATYDPAGNPSTMTDPYGGTDSYAYDALNRVTQATRQVAGTTEHVESYSYNALGAVHTTFDPVAGAALTLDDQRPKLSGSGTAPAAMVNTFNALPVTLDGGGRVTAINGATLAYQLFARVAGTTSTSGTTTTNELFAYDAYLRRTERTHIETTPTTSTTTKEFYVYDGDNIVAKVDGTGAAKDIYLYDGIDHPLRLSRAGVSTFYELDLAGNVRRLRDSSGNDLGGYRYTAFGQAFPADATTPAPAVNQPWQWKGRWFEPVAGGLYEMRARWWSPAVGAFLSVDEYAYHDRNSTLWGWPGQNPVRWRDPSGHWAYVSQTGSNVQIVIPIYFEGPGATSQGVTNIVNQIQNTWTGNFGGYNVTATVQLVGNPSDPSNAVDILPPNIVNLNTSTAAVDSYVQQWDYGNWDVNSNGVLTFAHEVSHLLGLADQYTNPNDITYGRQNWSPGARPTANDIRQAIRNNPWSPPCP